MKKLPNKNNLVYFYVLTNEFLVLRVIFDVTEHFYNLTKLILWLLKSFQWKHLRNNYIILYFMFKLMINNTCLNLLT